jgi:hypothetical protein
LGITTVVTATVVVVVDVVVVDVVVEVVVPGTVVVTAGTVVVVETPDELTRITDDPLGTASGFFVVPYRTSATRPLVTVALEIVDVTGHVAVTCNVLRAAVAALQLIPSKVVGSVTSTGAGPLDTTTFNVDPPATLVPAAGD